MPLRRRARKQSVVIQWVARVMKVWRGAIWRMLSQASATITKDFDGEVADVIGGPDWLRLHRFKSVVQFCSTTSGCGADCADGDEAMRSRPSRAASMPSGDGT